MVLIFCFLLIVLIGLSAWTFQFGERMNVGSELSQLALLSIMATSAFIACFAVVHFLAG